MRRRLPRSAVLCILLLLPALLGGCAPDRDAQSREAAGRAGIPEARPIVLISIDTLRSDRLPVYGYDRVETPAIDALRADSILYERAYSPVPLTLPAHASLLTGLLPPGHGVRDNAGYRLAEDGPATLAEMLGSAGYATGGAVSAFVMRRETGLARGFDTWEDSFAEATGRATMAQIQRSGGDTLRAALEWLDTLTPAGGGSTDGSGERSEAAEPFFLFFHIYEPHTPYEPPEPFASRYASAYDGEVAASDRIVGDLVAALRDRGLYAGSTLLLLSDHGEGLGDHGEDEHGVLLYRESLQVPLLLKLPGNRRAGETVATPAQLTDVVPTLLELAGEAARQSAQGRAPEGLDGTSLLALDGLEETRALYAETYHPRIRFGWSELRSLIEGRYHYIRSPRSELYDLETDPGETEDLIRDERRVYARLRDRLEGIDPRFEQPFREASETREALASLGYLGGSAGAEDSSVNPTDHLAALDNLRTAIQIAQEGGFQDALPRLRRATEEIPRSVDAWQFLGLVRQQLGQRREALDAYEKAFDLSNGAPSLAKPMAGLALELGETEDAVVYLDVAIEHEPDEPRLRFLKTRTLLVDGRLDAAGEAAEAMLRRTPDNPDAHYLAGAVAMARKDVETAERRLRRALEIAPRHPGVLNDLAVLLMSQGRKDEARPLLERLLEIQPDNARARQTLERIIRN